jgi:hypothetical protein
MDLDKISRISENNKELALEILKEGKPNFYYLFHPEIKKDKDIVFETIKNNELNFILQDIPKEVFDDKEFLLKCFNQNPYLIRVFPELEKDKENVLKAVSMIVIPCLYKTLSDEMKWDKDVVIRALETDGRTLYYVPEDLKNDKDVLIAAFKGRENQPGIIDYAPDWIKEQAQRFEELGNDIEKLLKEMQIIEDHKELVENLGANKVNAKKLKV